jgi:AraC-like DNA-binding protein
MTDLIRFDQPQAGLQRLSARFGGHAYDPHRHETYAVGLTMSGAQSFHYRGALRTSRAGQVMVLHPDEEHDGHATAHDGFAYRMLYVDPALVSTALGGRSPPFVPEAVADDAALAELVRDAFADFPQPLEPLALDALVSRMAELLAARSDGEAPASREPAARREVMRARDFLAAEALRTVKSEELEKVSGLDRFALARHFRAAFGTSPHRFQVGQRLAKAQLMIAEGVQLSETAAATGFADQSHLTRHFAARFGVTPGRWSTLLEATDRRSPPGTGR